MAKTETKLLLDAAGRGGTLQLPDSMKPVARARLLGKLEAEGLIAAGNPDGADAQLSPAGYRAIGLRAPRRTAGKNTAVTEAEAGSAAETPAPAEAPRSGTKRNLIAAMLARPDGASLDELIAATGWLPHTTRAALSRIRKAGQLLATSTRPDGRTAYRLEQPPSVVEPVTTANRRRARKTVLAELTAAA